MKFHIEEIYIVIFYWVAALLITQTTSDSIIVQFENSEWFENDCHRNRLGYFTCLWFCYLAVMRRLLWQSSVFFHLDPRHFYSFYFFKNPIEISRNPFKFYRLIKPSFILRRSTQKDLSCRFRQISISSSGFFFFWIFLEPSSTDLHVKSIKPLLCEEGLQTEWHRFAS